MLKRLFTSCSSACFEFDNTNPYYNPKGKYNIYLNGKKVKQSDTNVFSLFGLTPGTEYTVTTSVDDYKLTFHTESQASIFNVKKLGAVGDGKTDDTYYIQMAILSCPLGGRIFFPAGKYKVRPLTLKSDITIELEKGAVILGSEKEHDYPYVPARVYDKDGKEDILSSWEGEPFPCHQSFISAYRCENIKIVGEGTIDGNASKSTWWLTPTGRKVARPRLVFLNKCRNVYFHGVTCTNSASWNLHPYFSKNLGFYDIKVKNPSTAPNTDGLDPESCDRVEIIGCKFSVGDDCVAIKSGKIYMGKTYKTPADHHTLRNNLFQDGHGAIVLGSEMSGGVKNLTVSQCLFKHTDRGLRIKTRRGRGKDAIIDGIKFENIKMENVLTPFVINMYYHCDPDGHSERVWTRKPQPVDESTPYIGEFHFKDIDCADCEVMCAYFDGLVEQPIKSITIENVHFSFIEDARPNQPAMLDFVRDYCREGIYLDNVENVYLKNVTFTGLRGDNIIRKNCGNVTIEK